MLALEVGTGHLDADGITQLILRMMTAAHDYDGAMQVLSSHDWIIQPVGLEGALDFDDQAERVKIASSGLGEYQARQIAKLDAGVRYHRYDVPGRRSQL